MDEGANLKGRFPITKGKTMDFKELFEAALEAPVDGEKEFAKRGADEAEQSALVAMYRFADACSLTKSLDQAVAEDEAEVWCDEDGYAVDADENGEYSVDENGHPAEVSDDGYIMVDDDGSSSDEENVMDEAMEKSLDSLQKKLENTEQRLAKMQDERDYSVWLGKAEGNLKFVPGESIEDLAKGLHEIAKHSPELADAQYKRLCDASAMLEKSDALNAVGTSGSNTPTPDDEFVAKRAAELQKDGKLSAKAAFIKAAVEAEKR